MKGERENDVMQSSPAADGAAAVAATAGGTASTSGGMTRRESLNDSIAPTIGGRLGTPSTSSLRDDPFPPSPTITIDSTMAPPTPSGTDCCNDEKRLSRRYSARTGTNSANNTTSAIGANGSSTSGVWMF